MRKLIAVLTLVPVLLVAKWIKTFDHGGSEKSCYVLELDDGSLIVLGEVIFEDSSALFLDKVDADANLLWSRLFEGSKAWMVIQTNDGGFAVTGTIGYGYPDPDSVLFLKLNSDGEKIWSRRYPGESRSGCIRQEEEGFTILGEVFIRIDSLGDTLYTRTFEEYYPLYYPVIPNLTDDGGYVICAYLQRTGNADVSSPQDFEYLTKLDSEGNVDWVDSTFSSVSIMGSLNYLAQGHEGFVYIGDIWYFDTTMDANDNIVVAEWGEPNEFYEPLWQTEIGEDNIDEHGKYISRTSDDCYIATGNPFTLIKLSIIGDVIWTREIAGFGCFVQELSDGGFIITGTEDDDLLLIKTDSLGYVGIEESPVSPGTLNTKITTTIGAHFTLRYTDHPEGFYARVFNASGRRVGVIHSSQTEGTVTWGDGMSPGVYFIREVESSERTHKVVLIR